MLAGLPKAPGTNNPVANPRRAPGPPALRDRPHAGDRLHHRRAGRCGDGANRCSCAMPRTASRLHAEYVAETVRQMMLCAVRRQHLHQRAQGATTSLVAAEQQAAYRSLRKRHHGLRAAPALSRARGLRRPAADDPKALDDAVDDALAEHPDNGDLVAAVVLQASAKEVRAVRANGETLQIAGEGLRPAQSGLADKAARNIRIRPRRGDPRGADAEERLGDHAAARGRGRLRGAGPAQRRDPGAGGRLRLRQEQVQPRDAGLAPAGLELQALHLFGRAREGLHAGHRGQRCAAVLRGRRRRHGLGAEELRRRLRRPDHLAARTAASRRTWSRCASCSRSAPRYAQDWVTRFGFEREKQPANLPMALGAGSVTPMQMAAGYAVFANGGFRVNPYLVTRVTDARGKILMETEPPVLDETRARDPRAQCVHDGFAAAERGEGRHRVARLPGDPARPTCTARPAPPTIRSTPGSPASSRPAWASPGSATTQPRQLGVRGETGGSLSLPIWTGYMQAALKNVPVGGRPRAGWHRYPDRRRVLLCQERPPGIGVESPERRHAAAGSEKARDAVRNELF